jgi:hypothetical protein
MDAGTLFGSLAGALSLVLPYFLGLAIALGALGFAIGLVRLAKGEGARLPTAARGAVLAVAGAGWCLSFFGSLLDLPVRGLWAPTALGPLWWVARRPLPFGGL